MSDTTGSSPAHEITAAPSEEPQLSCAGKVAFSSPAFAHAAARRAGGGRNAYRCPACGFWHTADKHQPPKLKAKRRRCIALERRK